jgi:hypothetical protein
MRIAKTSGAVAVCLGLAIWLAGTDVAGQKGGGKDQDTPVTSVLSDTGSVADGTNYRIQSDGMGAYTSSTDRKDPIESVILTSSTCCQDWMLGTIDSTSRGVLVDFRDPVAPTTVADAPVDWQIGGARPLVQCHHVSSTSFPGIAVGQSLDCPVVILVDAPRPKRTWWRIALGYTGQPGTEPARVTCLAADGLGCSEWAIVPAGVHDGEAKSIGRLLLVDGNRILSSHGDYYFSFSFHVTRP